MHDMALVQVAVLDEPHSRQLLDAVQRECGEQLKASEEGKVCETSVSSLFAYSVNLLSQQTSLS